MDDDATLVRQAVDGSLPAFTAICTRYEARVHDVALALLRDRRAARTVMNDTFAEASEHLERLRVPERLPVWLLAIARYHAGLVAGPTAGPDRQPVLPDDDPDRVALISQVWEATADLPLRDRALLELHLRQGLDGQDLCDALGVSAAQGPRLRNRLADLERGLTGYLTMRGPDRRCGDLPLVLRGWDGHFTALVADGIAAHVSACRVCEQSRAGLPAPLRLYSAALPAPLPAAGVGPIDLDVAWR